MEETILSIPQQLIAGIQLGAAKRVEKPYRHIISCGMGGSSMAGEMLSMVKDDVIVHWDYDLPVGAGTQDLAICTSWSGNTEETISSYEKAISLGLETLVITTGGRLAELARANSSELIILPNDGIAPRLATGYMAGALFTALGMESHLPTNLDPAAWQAPAKTLSETLGNRMPVIYTSYPWRKIAGFWKMAYSETAKQQVMVNWFPSGAHNEVVGWEGPYQNAVSFVFLQDSGDMPRYTKNFDALLALLEKKEYSVSNVGLSGSTLLEKVFNSYLLALWTSLTSAETSGMDPIATALLDEFKQLKK